MQLLSHERRQAVDALLTSETFRRAEQLKRLLSYLYEQDEIGRIHEVTEYELGTRALGRPTDFTPDLDSTVRTRMHGLRQKLDEYYESQPEDGQLRLEIPKGAYRLHFHPVAAEVIPLPKPKPKPKPKRRAWLIGAGAGAMAVAGAVWYRPSTALDTLWSPMVQSAQPPVLLVGQPVHVWVRDIAGQTEPLDYVHFPDPVPNSPHFQTFLKPRLNERAKPVLHPSPNATLWGDAAGAAAAAQFLAFRKVTAEFLPESAVQGGVALRGRPVLAFGRPEYSPAIQRYLLAAGGYTVGMLNAIRRYSIYRSGQVDDHYVNTQPPNEVNYGLVTVLNDGGARVFVFSGITSDGTGAGLDYFTHPPSVAQLWELLRKEGHADWPAAFQVVLRVTSSAGYAMAARYEKHVVLQAKSSGR